MRTFDTGATRDGDAGKIDYDGFLSPLALERYGQYMHAHRKQADGKLRASDNWQKGIPIAEYMKSKWRHFMDTWKWMRHTKPEPAASLEDSLCAELFNTFGLLHELLRSKQQDTRPAATRKTAYLSHPIRGKLGDAASPEDMKANNEAAAKEAAHLRQHLPWLDIYVPAEHDEVLQAVMASGKLSVSSILFADIQLILRRDILLVWMPDHYISAGMEMEIEAARGAGKPVIMGTTCDELLDRLRTNYPNEEVVCPPLS